MNKRELFEVWKHLDTGPWSRIPRGFEDREEAVHEAAALAMSERCDVFVCGPSGAVLFRVSWMPECDDVGERAFRDFGG